MAAGCTGQIAKEESSQAILPAFHHPQSSTVTAVPSQRASSACPHGGIYVDCGGKALSRLGLAAQQAGGGQGPPRAAVGDLLPLAMGFHEDAGSKCRGGDRAWLHIPPYTHVPAPCRDNAMLGDHQPPGDQAGGTHSHPATHTLQAPGLARGIAPSCTQRDPKGWDLLLPPTRCGPLGHMWAGRGGGMVGPASMHAAHCRAQ